MKDVKIIATSNRTYLVKATTRRFGEDAVMFESWSWKECLRYLSRHGIEYKGKRPEFPRRRANNTTITRYTDRWNPDKVWLIKRYADGHYGINQEIAGRVFYQAYQRTTKAYIQQLFEDC